MRCTKRGSRVPYGLSRRDADDDLSVLNSVFLRVPLFPWFHSRKYDIRVDDFGRGWFMYNVLFCFERHGQHAFGVRVAFGAMPFGKLTYKHQTI